MIDFSSVIEADGMYENCSNMTSLTFNNLINDNLLCENIVNGCTKLTTLGFTGKTNKNSAKKVIDSLNNFILESKTSVFDLSKRVDEEVLNSLMLSTDIFEMTISILGLDSLPRILSEKPNSISKAYATLIKNTKKDIEDIPLLIKPHVEEILKQGGR